MNKLRKCSYVIIGSMEKLFFKWGKIVGLYPWTVIVSSFLITALASLGMFYFRIEQQANELWIPPWSNFNTHQEWLKESFPSRQRDELILIETDNVLTPEAIRKMYEVYKKISEIEVNGKTFDSMCFKVPLANIFHVDKRRRRRRRRRTAEPVEIGQTLENVNPIKIDQIQENAGDVSVTHTHPGTGPSISQLIQAFSSNSSNPNNANLTMSIKVDQKDDSTITLEAIEAKQKDNPEEVTTADSYDDFVWNDYEDYNDPDYEYIEIQKDDERYYKPAPRIDYSLFGKQPEQDIEEDSSPLNELPPDVRCGVSSTLREKCLLSNLLEIWRFKEDLIMTTTQQEIIDAVNFLERSPWSSHKTNFTEQLGGVVRNASGHVVSARAAQLYWNIEVPDDVELITGVGGGVEITFADADTLEWETRFIDAALSFQYPGVSVLPNAVRSFGDLNEQAILFDLIKLAIGYSLMFVYTVFMLGRINKLEMRLYLTGVGIMSVGMGIVMGVGLSSLLGYPYTPIHSALPFLCLGIGIDDMFVIVQCWYNIKKQEGSDMPLHIALGHTLRHAGVSVTITTLTDVFAFAVGAITIMPGLESFCVCTAIALGSIYLLQISWFTAFLALDQRRINEKRNWLVPCVVHHKYDLKHTKDQETEPVSFVVKYYSKILASKLYRGVIILISLGFVCVAAWGATLIKQKFDPYLLLPLDTYLRKYLSFAEDLYPDNGWDTTVYTGEINYTQLHNIDQLFNGMAQLKQDRDYIRNYDGFWDGLKEYAQDAKNFHTFDDFSSPSLFPMLLSDFLFSPDGGKYKKDFLFAGDLECGKPTPEIVGTKFKVNLKVFHGPDQHIPARRALEKVINSAHVSDIAFSHVKIYAAWETDEIIGMELFRNVGLALAVISVITLILLTDLKICVMVFACVLFTLTDIVGFLHFWGMTIDIISAVSIVLAIGLCVDYCVHIGHAFLIAPGNRLEKSINALETIGPAVFNGGFTTLLAVIVMAFSKSSVFLTFFKVFFLTVNFGLFHGLVFLPVILSIFGPVSIPETDSESGEAGSSGHTSGTSSGGSSPPSTGPSTPSPQFPSVIGQGQANRAYIQGTKPYNIDLENKEVESWRPGSIVKVFSKKTGSLDIGPTP